MPVLTFQNYETYSEMYETNSKTRQVVDCFSLLAMTCVALREIFHVGVKSIHTRRPLDRRCYWSIGRYLDDGASR